MPEYYWFEPHNCDDWVGFELDKQSGIYKPMMADAQNRLVSRSLGLGLTRWHGVYEGVTTTWLRWETLTGELLPTPQEVRDSETERANIAEQRAERLAQLLREQGIDPDSLG